jgi:amino acid adenylation domain-containing protein
MSAKLGLLAIPTAQRPTELRRAVSSYAAHLTASGQRVPIVVFHSARSAAEQAEVQGALRSAVSPGTPEPRYVGLGEKLALAKDLRRATKVPPELLDLALFNPRKQREAPGANRNAVLLWGAGQRLLSCDDDTVAELSAHPGLSADAALLPGIVTADPCDCLVPPDGELEGFRLGPGDARWPADGLPGALGRLWDATEALGTPAPLVFLGLSGDCGWSAPFGFFGMPFGYLQLGPATLTRLAATPLGWKGVLGSRTLLRVTPRPLLSRGAPGMTTAIGIDARLELPPFVPVGRGEDLLFCAITERLRGAPSAHLPLAVGHKPPGVRRFHEGELWRAAQSFDLCRTFFALLETLPAAADLAGLGRHLKDQSGGTLSDFEAVVRAGRRAQAKRLCAGARAYAEAQAGLPAWWRDDLLAYCDLTEQAAAAEGPLWVLDAGPADPAGSLESARALVQGYGALCEAWPALFRAARERAREDRGPASDLPGATRSPEPPPAGPAEEDAPSPPVPAGPSRCSPYQTWLWRLHRLDPADSSYVIFLAVRGAGPLDAGLLELALRALAGRHHALRCRLVTGPEDEPLLDLRPPEELSLLRAGPLDDAELERARRAERVRPFDLAIELPLRATLLTGAGGAGRWELWLAAHHAAFDGASEELFWPELETIYQNLVHGRAALHGLKTLRLDYRALALRQRAALTPLVLDTLERHWRARLDGAPDQLRVSFRTADPAAGAATGAAAVHRRVELPALLAGEVRRLAREQRVSLAALTLAAWQALLSRWSGERDVLVAVNFANRWDEVEEEQIGLFMSVLPVRADLSGDPQLLEVAGRARAALGDVFEHGRLPFERLVHALGSGRRRFALFHALFTHQVKDGAPRLAGAPVEVVELDEQQTGFDLGLTVLESGEKLSALLLGSAALFDGGDLQRLGEALAACLTQVCRDPQLRLSQVAWLSAAEEARLAAWNRTDTDYPRDQPLTTVLRERAGAAPSAIALEAGEERLTYAELQRRATLLAARLRGRGVTRDAAVGVYLDRHPRMLEAILGVLEAGGGYLPLDPAFPRERLAFMIEDASVRVLVTRRGLMHDLPPHQALVVCVDEEEAPPPAPAGGQGPDATSLAYVLYTSGSTGKPKGVEVTHRALVNFLCSMARAPGLAARDGLLALTTLSFDIAGLELWLPLLVGGRVVLGGREEAADGALLAAALARSGATALQATPSTWRILLASGWEGNPSLKALVGGEALPPDLAAQLAEACGEAWNLYGPTETTIWSAVWRIPKGGAPVRIGGPIANTQLHVLDERMRPLPLGVTGELWIGGDGVARGYLGRPELTAARFVPDPFRPGGRLYRTGDLARWLPEGEVEFLGRNDDQIKLRGYRIEPGEIEAALHQIDGVAQAAVGLHKDGADGGRLVAYLVAKDGATLLPSADLRAQLRSRLAEYLLPYHFVEVTALPMTPNGKVDRKRLDGLFRAPPGEAAPTAPALDALEASLVAEFTDLLGRPAGPETDFFEAGGDSISALRLISRLGRSRGAAIAGGDLFLHSTPQRLAAHLRKLEAGGTATALGRHLRLLREGTGTPIVFVHPIGGEMLPYLRLAQHLGAGAPVFGLQTAGVDAEYRSLAERCTVYAEELKRVSAGPFHVGGYSLGGVLAMELATQLRRSGHEVRWVFLLDAWVPNSLPAGAAKLRHRLRELRRFRWGERWLWVRWQLLRLAGFDPEESLLKEASLIDADLIRVLGEQALRWCPPPYEGNVLLFRAEMDSRGYSNPPGGALGWDVVCPRLEVIRVPGHHHEMLAGSAVVRIAREMERRMGT